MFQVEQAAEESSRKRLREEWTEASHKLLVKFLAELMDYAVRYGRLGTAVSVDKRANWVNGWVNDLKENNFQDLLFSKLRAMNLTARVGDVVTSLEDIYLLAKNARAQTSDLEYVLYRVERHTWTATVKQLLVACIKWKTLGRTPLDFDVLDEMTNARRVFTDFVTELVLDTEDMPGPNDRSAESFEKAHETDDGHTFFRLKFAATVSTAVRLIERRPKSPLPNDYSTSPPVIPPELGKYLGSPAPALVISVSGETGSGKTTSVLLALKYNRFVTFYATADDLSISGLEDLLKEMADSSRHAAMAAEHLVSTMTHHRGWMPTKPTKRRVALVIDELGQYPLATRAIAKIVKAQTTRPIKENASSAGEENTKPSEIKDISTSIELFQQFFMSGDVRIILVGTGTDHAFSAVGSLPATHAHVSANDFSDVTVSFEKHSMQWRSIKNALDPIELQRGIFLKILRLSRNPRMAAILGVLDRIGVDDLLCKVDCRGVKQSELRDHFRCVLWGALRESRKYNAMRTLHSLQATTHFSCAFAIACSNEEQKVDYPLLRTYVNTYGLLRDCTPLVTEGTLPKGQTTAKTTPDTPKPKVMTHRFEMSPATVEIGLSSFGMTMPNDGWVGFESMMCSLLYLHAFGASCAARLNIELSGVDSKLVSEDEADPIAKVKTWIRLRAKCATSVVQGTLKEQVRSCGDAAAALKRLAKEQVSSGEERQVCIVVARNGDCVSFADVIVGLVVPSDDDHGFHTTHLLLLRLKYLDNTPFSVHDEWRELYKMGSTDVRALVADCAAKLEKYRWDDAMARIHVSKKLAEQCHKNCDFKKPAGREDVFAAICRGNPSQRALSSYEAELHKYTHDGSVSIPSLAAKFLSDQMKAADEPTTDKITSAFRLKRCQASHAFVLDVNRIMENDDATVDEQFTQIVEAFEHYERFAADNNAPSRFPHVQKHKLTVDRFVVLYRCMDSVPPQRVVGVLRPDNILVIDNKNRPAAFYPTGWEHETFKPETRVTGVFRSQ
ncbi:Hypothetical protein, putative [Bodo saltans]|uniref:Uncharacterized protein n=1 Tax=Bodo saltans TaxID=75058 RepID=A0A0S4JIL2_BODSA|nr:Hypothetical protein, putative [Bodo saltans]|eukprot:CUG89250.1 Hypothetical protein, putative [Bodo saltans]